jgi:NTE family protein
MPISRLSPLNCFAISAALCAGMLVGSASAQSMPASDTAAPTASGAQQASPAGGRQKIGLVLNGGGALGLAHVGVLIWLEQHHIPVDMVAGTSMGGLIGGAYATGESPAQIRALVEHIDWDKILSDQAPFRDISYRRKQDATDYPAAVQFGIGKKGVRFQEGVKSGQQVQLLLDQIALPYSQVQNFDNLPIPFGCVATDLVSGKAHVFRTGSLALALRATMSLPGIFAPVRANGTIYADGGLLDNLPVDVARQMGADLTLAIYLQTAPLSPSARLSSVGVLGRGISVMIAANELKSIQDADIVVTVPLAKFTALDYDKADAIIQAGYNAAQAKAAVLEKLSVDDAAWNAYLAARNARRRTVPVPQFVAVNGINKNDASEIKRTLEPDLNQPIVPDTVARQLTTVASNQRVSDLSYGLARSTAGVPGIGVTGREDPYGRNIIRPLILVDGWDLRNVIFSIGGRLTMLDLGSYGSELRIDGLFGSEYMLSAEYYHPVDSRRHFFLAPRGILDDAPLNYYNENGLVAEYRTKTQGGGIDIGDDINPSSEIRLGYEAAYFRLYPNVVDPTALPTHASGREGDTHLRYVYDHLDNPITPESGLSLKTDWEWWDAKPVTTSPFPVADLEMLDFIPVSSASSIYLGASGGSTLWTNPPILPPPFSLGGSFRLPAYNTNELLTNQYFLFQGGYVYQLSKLSPLVGGKVLLFGGVDVGKVYYEEPASGISRLPSDGSAGILVNTLLGPVVFGGAIGDRGHHKFFFEIGQAYF